MSKLHGFSVPPVSMEFLKDMEGRFQSSNIEPETHRDKIMFNAGQQAVIAFIRAKAISGSKMLGSPDDTKD